VLLLLAGAGLAHTFRRSHFHGLPSEAPSPPLSAAELAALCGCALRPGHRVELLENGHDLFPRLWSDLAAARRSITISMYYGESGEVTGTLGRLLLDRVREGVRVCFLYDPIGCRGIHREYFAELRGGGVAVHPFRPLRPSTLGRWNSRMHARALVVDGTVGYTGGFSFSDRWRGTGDRPGHWREMDARFEGPAVHELQGGFAGLWLEATGAVLSGDAFFAPAVEAPDGTTAGVLFSTPGVGASAAERYFATAIGTARERLWVRSGYFVPDPGMVRLLSRAAARGVDVRVLTASIRHTDIAVAYLAGRFRYRALLSAGVRIYEYEPSMMHAKTLVADGTWCSVGGVNLDNRSQALNTEATLLIWDASRAAEMETGYRDDLELSREIRLVDLRRDSPLRRLETRLSASMWRLL
jgi:cardiolipin synthase